ncbi:MAG: hypothetical protein HY015_10440, partial [Bacteroidetes bacterium]|nr:hypothetical protein [Bacteroidota bacterium]
MIILAATYSTMLVLIFAFLSLFNENKKELHVVEDLQPRWKTLHEGKFIEYKEHPSKTVYLSLGLKGDNSDFFRIHSQEDFYLFINSNLIVKSRHLMLNIDSLKK